MVQRIERRIPDPKTESSILSGHTAKIMTKKNNMISIGGALIYKESRGKRFYWLVGMEEAGWEIPKVTVRRGESSVRAAIRMSGEQGGMNTRVLEEVGRVNSIVVVNGKAVNKRIYYYLLVLKSAGEVLGFEKYRWLDYQKAFKAVSLKRERGVLKEGEALLKKWERERKKKK